MSGLAPGALIAGKFRLEAMIGRGGMGSVWAARHEQLDMLVALKFIEAEAGTDLADARARFEREAKAAAQIRSPHVAQIIDHGIDGDRPYIAMELLEGEDLGERLRREGRISLAAAAKIVTQAAKALRRAHEAGIIHRDLKPGNIYLARFDDDEIVKILDFGVAKVRAAGAIDGPLATQTGIVFGSPSYMSPEQARGVRTLDHRSDLWSLAVIVFRAVTGVKPFQAASIGDLVVKLCIDPLPVATSFAPDLPPEIDRFFERAFAREPDKRFPTAVDLAAALEAVATGVPAATRAPLPPASTAGPPSSSGPSVAAIVPRPVPRPLPAPPVIAQPARAPAQQLPPAPPLVAPAPIVPPSAPPPPSVGSGSHVAFAPGTLTPPPGSAVTIDPIPPQTASFPVSAWPVDPAPLPPSPAPIDADALTLVRPFPQEPSSASRVPVAVPPAPIEAPIAAPPAIAEPPVIAAPLAIAAPPAIDPSPAIATAPAAPPDRRAHLLTTLNRDATRGPERRRLVIGAVVGASAFALLAVVLFVIALSGGSAPSAPSAASAAIAVPSHSATAIEPAEAGTATAITSAAPTADPVASVAPVASSEPAPSASAADSAEPDPSAKPKLPIKPGKKRPNFGY
ncbi:MAG: serine/threonine-protein kinase [Minicystis sp.]